MLSEQESTDSGPQQFQVIIQMFYHAGSSKANALSSTDTAWHQQCRNDLSALKFPFPPTSSLVCSVSQGIVQMAWNVRATDHIVKQFGRAFNPAAPILRETQEKLDSLDIHQVTMLKRWTNPSGGESLTLAGLLQSSNASKDHGKTSMDTRRLDAQTNTSFTVLPQSSLRHGEQSSFSRKSFPNQQTVSSASLSKILSPMLPPSPTPSPDLSFITDRPNISTNPANSPGTASSLSDVNTHPPRTRKRTNHLDRKSPLPSTVSPATKRPKLDDDDDNHSSSHISSNLQRKFTDLKSLLEQEKKGRIAAETQLCRLQQQLVDSGLNASQIDLLQAVGIAERDKEAYKARSKELEREIVSLKGQLEGDHSAVHRSQDRTERGKKEADILQDEIDVLRMKNKSLEEELRKFKHAPDLRNEETKALRTRIEQQRQQLEEYALRVNPNDGMSTLGVDEKRSDSSSEAAAFDQKRIIPRVKQEELDRVRRELDQERDRRVALEGIVDDMKRECRSPFIVPALVGAFAEISRLTTKVKVRIEDEKDAIEVDRRLQLDHE